MTEVIARFGGAVAPVTSEKSDEDKTEGSSKD